MPYEEVALGRMRDRDGALMRRAIDLTARTDPHPNPRVGAIVIGRDGEIVAEHAHVRAGEVHAEAAALQAAGAAAAGSTLVVTLEPCAHHGRTPPCTEAIIDAGVKRVVVGARDPDLRVAGKGIEALRRAGIEVDEGIEVERVHDNDRSYFHHRSTGMPYVTLKLAMTLDGQVAAADRTARWITGPEARLDGHRLRAESDVVLVGNGTVIDDDPLLDVRIDGYEGRQPRPAIVAGRRPVPADARLMSRHPIVFCVDERYQYGEGVEVVSVPGPGVPDLEAVFRYLGERDVLGVLIEGGPTVASVALRRGLVDRAVLYYGAKFGLGTGIPGTVGVFSTIEAAVPVAIVRVDMLGGDVRVEGVPDVAEMA